MTGSDLDPGGISAQQGLQQPQLSPARLMLVSKASKSVCAQMIAQKCLQMQERVVLLRQILLIKSPKCAFCVCVCV